MGNLCEEMHLTMTRKALSNDIAMKLKPNKQAKDKLEHIINVSQFRIIKNFLVTIFTSAYTGSARSCLEIPFLFETGSSCPE